MEVREIFLNGGIEQQEGEKKTQYLITLAAVIIVLSAGSTIGWSSPALPYLQSEKSLQLTDDEASWVGSLLTVGALFGALPAGPLADMLGRKNTILGLSVPLLLSWILIGFANSVWIIYLARILAGLSLGAACTVIPLYISEIAEASVRGMLGSSFQLFLVIGILYTYAFAVVASYQMLTLICGLVPIIFAIAFFKAPESPMFLLKKDRRNQAERAIRLLRGKSYNTHKELHALENELAGQSQTKVPFARALGKKASIKALIICLGLMTIQQLCGINVVIFYANSIFKDAGSSLDAGVASIIVGLAQVIACAVSAILIDKAGRKILLQISVGSMSISLALLGYYFSRKSNGDDVSNIAMLPLGAVVVFILMFSFGIGPIPWMMSGEVLPPEIKGVATGIAVGYNWGLAFLVTKSFMPLVVAIGAGNTYYCFAGSCVIGLAFVTIFVIETKGKSLNEIQNELQGKKRAVAGVI